MDSVGEKSSPDVSIMKSLKRPKKLTPQERKEKLIEKYDELLLKEPQCFEDISDTCFRIIRLSKSMEDWKNVEKFAKEAKKYVKDSRSLQGACEYYIGLSISRRRNFGGAVRCYLNALSLFGYNKKNLISVARVNKRLGDLAVEESKRYSNLKDRRKLLNNAFNCFLISSESLSIENNMPEYQKCVGEIATTSCKISSIDGNKSHILERAYPFLVLQLQRTDADKSRNYILRLINTICGEKIDIKTIIENAEIRKVKIKELLVNINNLEEGSLHRKVLEFQLATCHFESGENINAIIILNKIMEGLTSENHQDFRLRCLAAIGLCWFSLCRWKASLNFLKYVAYYYNKNGKKEDYEFIKSKIDIAVNIT